MTIDPAPAVEGGSDRLRLEQERDRLRLLIDVTNVLVSRRDLGDLFAALSGILTKAVAHEYASISLFGARPGDAAVRLVVLDAERQPALEGRAIQITDGNMELFSKGEAVRYDLPWLARFNPPTAAALGPRGLQSFCSVPLTTARTALGIMSVASREADAFDDEAVAVLQQVSGQIAIALENGLAYEEIQRLKDLVTAEKKYLEDDIRTRHDFTHIVGQGAAIGRLLEDVERVATTTASVLITGETGTGKELIAHAIHDRSGRAARSFVCVNCAAIPSELVESELFGSERGAFTGAVSARPGRFEVADGGTLFLDEVGDLPIEVQPKLLRVLQDRTVERLGATRPRQVDVRIIAATNRELSSLTATGDFREDLYYRLNVFPIRVPPLRERREDIPALVRHFANKHGRRLKRSITSIPAPVMQALTQWIWPGNVRELENVIERAIILSEQGVLRVSVSDLEGSVAQGRSGGERLVDVERDAILSALRSAGGIVGGPTGAAARLGLKRTTLNSRLRKLGIRRPGY